MSFIAWLVLGLIAGWIASMIVNKSGEGCFSISFLVSLGQFSVVGSLIHLAIRA